MPTFTTNYNIPKPLVNDPQDEDLWGGFLNDGMDIIDAQMKANADAAAAILPVGMVVPYAGSAAPSGWLLCFGQNVSRTTYAALFAVIGTTYGAGDGVTTFGLPDLRGRTVAGKDDMGGTSANRLTGLAGGVDGDVLGGSGGAETHTLTTAQMPNHDHDINILSSNVAGAGTALFFNGSGGFSLPQTTAAEGGGQAHNNVQPTFILNYIIKT